MMKYSIDEIDFMRWGTKALMYHETKSSPGLRIDDEQVERRLRTYLTTGVPVSDFADKVFSVQEVWPSLYAPFYPVEYEYIIGGPEIPTSYIAKEGTTL